MTDPGPTSCTGVTVQYANGDYGLRDATAVFATSASTAVVGQSGSGKSSLLNTLCGLAPVVSGTVEVAGHALRSGNEAQAAALRRTQIGIVFQDGLLLKDLDCVDNVALPLRLQGVRRSDARTRARRILTELGLGRLLERKMWELSGGQRQRAAVARAVVTNPPLLLADEPTGALDRSNADATISLLLDVAADRRSTLILVTHDLETAARCDFRLQVEDGQIGDATT